MSPAPLARRDSRKGGDRTVHSDSRCNAQAFESATLMGIAGQLFLQLAVILLVGRAIGAALRGAKQPQVVAEMVAGFVLGPSVFGALAPKLQHWVFPATVSVGGNGAATTTVHPSMTVLFAVGQLALVLYMFLVGVHLDTQRLKRHFADAGRVSVIGIALPMIAGGLVGFWLGGERRLFPASVSRGQAALFVAAALSVTAFPVLARILTDSGAAGSRIGTLALSAAAFDDAVAWILLAVTLASAEGSVGDVVTTISQTLLFVAGLFLIGRPLLGRLARMQTAPSLAAPGTIGILAVLLFSATLTERIGIHAVFGAFMVGAVLPRGPLQRQLADLIEPVTVTLLLPVFFVYAGLQARISAIDDWSSIGILIAIVGIAFVGKGGGCIAAMRIGGASWSEAGAMGALMNARGLMELAFISIALERGLITGSLYTMLAIMAIVTTMAAPPLFSWLHGKEARQSAAAAHSVGDGRRPVMVE